MQEVLVGTDVGSKLSHCLVTHIAREGVDYIQLLHVAVVVGVGKAEHITVADIRLVAILCHRPDLGVATQVDAAASGIFKHGHTFVKRGGGTIPVAGALVATTVGLVAVGKGVEGLEYLVYSLHLPLAVALAEQHARKPVAANPGVPVHAGRLPPVVGL